MKYRYEVRGTKRGEPLIPVGKFCRLEEALEFCISNNLGYRVSEIWQGKKKLGTYRHHKQAKEIER
ncbi:MAG: hypothetical protein ACXQTR_01010 [Candidatus Methanospirareceae archaeon]